MLEMVFELVDEMLDLEGDVIISGITFSRSAILKEMDPTAYRILCVDYADAHIQDLQYELDSLDEVEDFDEVEDLKARIAELESI